MAGSAQLEWATNGDGLVADRYRITRFSASFDPELRWRLEVADLRGRNVRHPAAATLHRTLDEAKSEARRHHRDRLRRARIGLHVALGTGSWTSLFFLEFLTGPAVGSFVELWLIVVLFNLGAGSLLDAFGIARHVGMGALEKAAAPEPRTWIDRSVVALVGWTHARRLATLESEPQAAAITLS